MRILLTVICFVLCALATSCADDDFPAVSNPILANPQQNTQSFYLSNLVKYKDNPVISPNDAKVWNAATFSNGKFYVFTGCPSIGTEITEYISDDGIHFKDLGIIVKRGSVAWDADMMEPHSCIYFNGQWRLYYCGQYKGIWNIGYAFSDDLLKWTKYKGNPVLTPLKVDTNLSNPYNEISIADPHCVVWNNKVWCYYHDYNDKTKEITASPRHEHVAWSNDGINFTKHSEPLNVPAGWNNAETGDVFVINDGISGVMMNYLPNENQYKSFFTKDGYTLSYSPSILLLPEIGKWDSRLIHCSIVNANGKYYLYYAGLGGGRYNIGVAMQ